MDYVLVHGTTQSPRGWERLAEALVRRGHRAVPVDLLQGGADLDTDGYADLVARQVAADAGEPPAQEGAGGGSARGPVVVVHSGAGALASAVASRLGASRVVWLAAFVPDTIGRRSLLSEIQISAAEMFNPEWTGLAAPPTDDPVAAGYFLFHDGDLATLRWGLETVRLFQPARVYAEPPRPLPQGVTSTYLLPVRDRTLRPEWMRAAAEIRLHTKAIEVDAGHCPHVSAPEEVASIIAG
ncbi:alpha/beta hydrolase [Streptomonospora sp. PA3]|uniref:alpha/beta hydrolase n=1 Tax=Streptomonospora sp. PA3 TaxID=2607326 RepID=UPI0012DD2F41|nr:alpha/beta hydrolase [Streptomonospora sp. PA3]MUL42385.1 alpha/beta hydrolase [Streptomonospora sp. PA3]